MIVTTGSEVDGYSIVQYLGVVRGSSVAPSQIRSFRLWFGNYETVRESLENVREQAYKRMVKRGLEVGAEAIIGMRFQERVFSIGEYTETLAYGTAVKLSSDVAPDTSITRLRSEH